MKAFSKAFFFSVGFCLALAAGSFSAVSNDTVSPPSLSAKDALTALDDVIRILPKGDDRDDLIEIREKVARMAKVRQRDICKKSLPRYLAARSKRHSKIDAATQNRTDNALADLANQVGDYTDAVDLSDAIVQRDPENRDAVNNRATAHLGLGDYSSAIAEATQNAKMHPDDETTLTIRSLAQYSAGNYLKAMEDAQRVLALNPSNETALYTLKLAQNRLPASSLQLNDHQKSQADEIKREYQTMLQQQNQAEVLGQQTDNSLERQAVAKILENKPGEAVDAATQALAADPKNPRLYVLRATAYSLLGQYLHAVEDAGAAITLDPKNVAAYDARAAALNQLGEYRDALADAFTAIAQNPQDAYAYANRARTYEKLRHFRAMMADYQTAAALNPQFERAYRDAVASFQKTLLNKDIVKPRAMPPSDPAPSPIGSRDILITLFATLIGGTLIALGVLHVFSNRYETRVAKRAATQITTDIGEALDSSEPDFGHSYKIVKTLGLGGMGIVYEAVDTALNRKVAIKKMRDEIRSELKDRKDFLREARTVAALHHPSIVEIYNILESDNDLFLVFEYVPGKTLTQALADKRRLSIPEAKEILRGVCGALDYAHQHHIVHRDLKPSNIILTDEEQVKVMDFGIARQAEEALSNSCVTDTVVGTPQYMAPEAEQGMVRKESDLYSLGVCLYEMLSGERPFPAAATAAAKAAMRYTRLSAVVPDIPPSLDALISAALQPDPDRRIHSAREFFDQFERSIRDDRRGWVSSKSVFGNVSPA